MKKIKGIGAILSLLIFAGCANAYPEVPTQFINSVQGIGGMQVHDMQLINQNRFRHTEYNDYKDMQEQKDAKNKEFEVKEPAMKRIFERRQNTDIQFVEENGQIKIQGVGE